MAERFGIQVRRRAIVRQALLGLVGLALMAPVTAHAEGDALVEFHFLPVPNAQIAIWLTDADGNFVQDVFVTQATGTLGIGNRPGRWDFLSSWRFPYGPRVQVLPIWAHGRGKTYPALVFHDDNPQDQESLGWHESTSSREPYFCRPLTQTEHDTISTDTMTCPSPSTFQSDKGRFHATATSVYPPRGDIVTFEDGADHADARKLAELNELDGISRATPSGMEPEVVTAVVPESVVARGPLSAHVEINLENDQNEHYRYDREDDHYVDSRLANFGIPYRGQPSVVYTVTFDPSRRGFTGTSEYRGYGDVDGESGTVHAPDDTISDAAGSGSDRLQLYTRNGETFRLGVFSHGEGSGEPDYVPDGGGGWGECRVKAMPDMLELEVEPVDFDRVEVRFRLPELEQHNDIARVRIFYRIGEMPLVDDNAGSAVQTVPKPAECSAPLEPGHEVVCEIDELFGSTTYQIGVRYEDWCNNASPIVSREVTTPAQQFATVEGLCFVATAAYGAPWAIRVQALRWFRDLYLKNNGFGLALVSFYYAYSPGAAKLIARHEFARAAVRLLLEPITNVALLVTDPSGANSRAASPAPPEK